MKKLIAMMFVLALILGIASAETETLETILGSMNEYDRFADFLIDHRSDLETRLGLRVDTQINPSNWIYQDGNYYSVFMSDDFIATILLQPTGNFVGSLIFDVSYSLAMNPIIDVLKITYTLNDDYGYALDESRLVSQLEFADALTEYEFGTSDDETPPTSFVILGNKAPQFAVLLYDDSPNDYLVQIGN